MKKKTDIQKLFDRMKDTAEISYVGKGNGTTCQNVFEISWGEKGRGFGTYSFIQDMKGKWTIDNECDGRDSIKRVMGRLIDSLPLRDKTWDEMRAEDKKKKKRSKKPNEK
jgi:hypothetical protein